MKTKFSINDLEKQIIEIAKRIKVNKKELPTFGYSKDFGFPHIEVDKNGYHYVVIERGNEISRQTTNDSDELLYWVFEHITFNVSCKFELENRIEKQDFRRIVFEKQEELLTMIKPEWGIKRKNEHDLILIENPFHDN